MIILIIVINIKVLIFFYKINIHRGCRWRMSAIERVEGMWMEGAGR